MFRGRLEGVEQGYELPPEATNNIYEMTPEERRGGGHRAACRRASPRRSRSWKETELVAEALGEHVFEYF